MFHYPCLHPDCSGVTSVLIPGHAKVQESKGRLAVYFAKDNRAKFGHICSLCFQKVTPEEAKLYELYQHGVDRSRETRV